MNIQELFGRQASVVSPFEYEQGLNQLFTSWGSLINSLTALTVFF